MLPIGKKVRIYTFIKYWFWNDVRHVLRILRVGFEVLKSTSLRSFTFKVAPIVLLGMPLIFCFGMDYFQILISLKYESSYFICLLKKDWCQRAILSQVFTLTPFLIKSIPFRKCCCFNKTLPLHSKISCQVDLWLLRTIVSYSHLNLAFYIFLCWQQQDHSHT